MEVDSREGVMLIVSVEFEIITKMECESGNDHLFKWGGVLHFAKMVIFWVILDSF